MIVGLGNPGEKYRLTRHNAGALAADALLLDIGDGSYKKDFGGLVTKVRHGSMDVVILKPQEFMNVSGSAVTRAMKFYRIEPEHMLVLHDEIELPFGEIRLKMGGGHKGHNGLRDIMAKIGTPEFYRLRMGVDRPPHKNVADYVLSNFSKDEQSQFDGYFYESTKLIMEWLASE